MSSGSKDRSPRTEVPNTPYEEEAINFYSDGKKYRQVVRTWLPRPPDAEDSKKYWVIYIHGGAWRDPNISYNSFIPTYRLLKDDPSADHIAGYASLSYRLSPRPAHPERKDTPEERRNCAKHPDHLHDVYNALAWLQAKYNFESKYILVGHSCGATLAFQLAMKDRVPGINKEFANKVQMPKCIIGLEGIYDLGSLVEAHTEIPAYREFVEGAFGPDIEHEWNNVSPTASSGVFASTWAEGVLVILGHSEDDELVEMAQVDMMSTVLLSWEVQSGSRRLIVNKSLKGKHDEIWNKGKEVYACIKDALIHLVCVDNEMHRDREGLGHGKEATSSSLEE